MVSRMPPTSPAAHSWMYSSSNTFGCSLSASAKVEPPSTFALIANTTLRNAGLSICVPRMSRHWTRGRPASIIVANCRVKMRMSFPVTPPIPGRGMWISIGFFLTLTGLRPSDLRRAFTASASPASISPFLISPCLVRASHSHIGALFFGATARWVTCVAAGAAIRMLPSGPAIVPYGSTSRPHGAAPRPRPARLLNGVGTPGRTCSRSAPLPRRPAARPRRPLVRREVRAGVPAREDVLELVRVRRPPERLLLRDEPPLEQVRQRLVEGLHPELRLAHLHRRVDLVDLVLADEVPDGGVGHHDLQRQDAPRPARLRQERLGQHALDDERELGADLRLLVRGEDVQDAVDGLDAVVRVQGPEADVAGLGDDERRLHRLEISHLADEHDVRVLAEDVLERRLEAPRVRPHLALVHQAVLVRVQVLDRILDRHDVLVTLAVDLVDDGRQRRRLAGARGPGHEHQAA